MIGLVIGSTLGSFPQGSQYAILDSGNRKASDQANPMSEPQPFVPSGRSHCHLCGKKLPLLRKIFGSGFCGDSHRSAYAVQQNEMALARLQGAALEAPAMCLLRADNAPQTRVDEMTEAHQILDFACFIKC